MGDKPTMENYDFWNSTKKLKIFWILELINIKNNFTQKDLANKVNISKSMANRYLQKLKKDKIIDSKEDIVLTKKGKKSLQILRNEYYNELLKMENFIDSEKDKYSKLSKIDLKVATIKSIGSLLPNIAKKLNLHNEYSINLDIITYIDGEELMENFLNKNFDLGFLGIVPAFLWKSTGTNINIEAELNTGGHSIIAKNNIYNINDLEDKVILVPRKNDSVSDNLLKRIIQKHKIDIKRIDFNDLNISYSDLMYDFNKYSSDFDALLVWEPYISYLLYKNTDYKIIHNFDKEKQKYLSNIMITNNNKNNINEFTLSLIEYLIKSTIQEVKSNNKVLAILANEFNMNKDIIKKSLDRINFYYKKWEE